MNGKLLKSEDIGKIGNKVYASVGHASEGKNPIEAREIAKLKTSEIFGYLNSFGININYVFGEETQKQFPDIVKAIENYMQSGEIDDILPLLWLGNHQAFGLEAMSAYNYFPTNGKILLKDELLVPPYFGKGIEAIDPIVYYRKFTKFTVKNLFFELIKRLTIDKSKLVDRRQRELLIQKQILEKKAVLIYPEGTRSKNGKLLKFNSGIYKPAYDILSKHAEGFSTKVALITSDSFDVFPSTLEKILFRKGKIYTGEVNIKIDIVDIEIGENIKDFNKRIYNIFSDNLKK